MDPAAFAALVEQCAPTPDLVRPLTAIVRQASSFEPLLITIEGRKPIPIQATDRMKPFSSRPRPSPPASRSGPVSPNLMPRKQSRPG